MLRYQPTPHVLVARPYADFCCVHEKSRPTYLLHVRQNHASFPTFGCIFAKITRIPTFCCMFAEITRIPSTHTHLHHDTTRGGAVNHVYSHLLHVRRNHAFAHLFLHVRKNDAYSHILLRKNVAKIAPFFAKFLQDFLRLLRKK